MADDLQYCWVCDETYNNEYHDEKRHKLCLKNMARWDMVKWNERNRTKKTKVDNYD